MTKQNNFNRKFMHPTRRKLANMVKTGEYEKDTRVGWDGKSNTREVGDIWEDDSHRYEKKEGYTMKTSKNIDVLCKVRDYLASRMTCDNPDCKRTTITPTDKKLIQQTGYCAQRYQCPDGSINFLGTPYNSGIPQPPPMNQNNNGQGRQNKRTDYSLF